MVWALVKGWPGCRGQALYRPPGSQPRRQRMQRLLSDLDIGSHRTGKYNIHSFQKLFAKLLKKLATWFFPIKIFSF